MLLNEVHFNVQQAESIVCWATASAVREVFLLILEVSQYQFSMAIKVHGTSTCLVHTEAAINTEC